MIVDIHRKLDSTKLTFGKTLFDFPGIYLIRFMEDPFEVSLRKRGK